MSRPAPTRGPLRPGAPAPSAAFTLTNTGDVATSAIAATLGGTDAGQFAIVSSSCATLGPAASCAISVVFQPTSAGTKAATLSMAATTGGAVTVTLGGTALPAALPQ